MASRFSCAITPSTRKAIGQRIVTILKEDKSITFDGLCKKMWDENFSSFVKNDKSVFALDCISQVPTIIRDYTRTEPDESDKEAREVYLFFNSRFTDEELERIAMLDAKLSTSEWYKTAQELAGGLSTTEKDKYALRRIQESEKYIKTINRQRDVPEIGSIVLFNDTLNKVVNIQDSVVVIRPIDAQGEFTNDTEYPLGNISEFDTMYECPTGITIDTQYRNERFKLASYLELVPKYVRKKDEKGNDLPAELFFNAKRNGADVHISFRAQEFPELYKISSDFGNITNEDELQTVYARVNKSSKELNIVTLELISPFVINKTSDVELKPKQEIKIEENKSVLNDAELSTMTSMLYRISQEAVGSTRVYDNENTSTPMNTFLQDRFITSVKKTSTVNNVNFNGQEIALKAEVKKNNIILSVCDLEGNIIKVAYNENGVIVENENGSPVTFLLDDMLGLHSDYNLDNLKGDKTYRQSLRSYFRNEDKYEAFMHRVNSAQAVHKELIDKINKGEKVIFDITSVNVKVTDAFNFNASTVLNDEKIQINVNGKIPFVNDNGNTFQLVMPVLSKEKVDYFVSLLSKELYTSPNIRLTNKQRYDILRSFFGEGNEMGIPIGNDETLKYYLGENGSLIFYINETEEIVATFNNESLVEPEEQFQEIINRFRKEFSLEEQNNGIKKGWSKQQLAISRNNIMAGQLFKPSITDNIIDVNLYNINDVFKDFGYRYKKYNQSYKYNVGTFDIKLHTESTESVKIEPKKDDKPDYSALMTSIEAKSHITKASEEQIAEAKRWYEKSPLYKYVKYESAFDIANIQGVAEWNKAAIILYKGSDYADLYHEAWHEFTQYWMSQEEKRVLYDAVGNLSGTFVDHLGEKVSYKDADDLQKEEKLAEMFRDYMLNHTVSSKWGKVGKAIIQFFKKIADFLKYMFSNKNEKIVLDAFEKLREGNLSNYKRSTDNLKFTKLYRSINCTQNNAKLSESDSYTIKNLCTNLMVDFLAFKYMNDRQGGINIKSVEDYMNEMYQKGVEEANKKYGLSEDVKNFRKFINSKYILDNKEDFSQEKIKEAENYLKTIQNVNVDVRSFLNDREQVKDAFRFIKCCMIHLNALKNVKLDTENSKENKNFETIGSLNYQTNLLKLAIENFGDINLLGINKKKEDVGVVGFYYKTTEYFQDIEEEEVDLDDVETALRDEHDPNPNAKSTVQRLDKELKFILSTVPSYKINENGDFIVDKDAFGVQKCKGVTAVTNMLSFLHGSVSGKEMYEKMLQHAYFFNRETGVLNKNIVINPMIKAVLDRLGTYDFGDMLMTDKPNSEMNKELGRFQLYNRFFNVFSTSEPSQIQVHIDVTKKFKEEESTQNGKKKKKVNRLQQEITDVTISTGEFSGSFWKFKSMYETKFYDINNQSKYKISQTDGFRLDVDKILSDFTLESAKKNKIAFINATGIALTRSKAIESVMNDQTWDNYIDRIYKKLKRLSLNKARILNPVNDIYYDYTERSTLRDILKEIINLDMTVSEDVNIEMVQNAEGNTLFKNQLNNTLTMIVNHINRYDNYLDMLNDPALKHLDVRPKIKQGDNWIDNKNFNPNVSGSNILRQMFNLTIGKDGTYDENTFGARISGANIKLTNFSGVKVSEIGDFNGSKGISLFKADKDTKILTDLALVLTNQQEFMRFADKGTSYGFYLEMENNTKWVPFAKENVFVGTSFNKELAFNSAVNKYIGYLRSEITRLQTIINLKKSDPEQYDHNFLNKADNFGFFDDIISKETQDELRKYINGENINGLAVIQKAQNDIRTYLEVKTKEQRELITSTTDKYKNVLNSYKKLAYPNVENVNSINDSNFLDGLAFFSFVNNQIYNFESIKLFFGDIMSYNHKKEEFTKRLGGFGSTGEIFNDDDVTRKILDNAHESSFAKTVLGIENNPYYEEEHEGELKTAVCADINPLTPYLDEIRKVVSKEFVTPYERVEEESNAQGLITLDGYRYLSLREGKWSVEAEKLFQKIIAYDKYQRSDKSAWTEPVPDEVNWNDTEKFFPVRKFQYIGPLNTDRMPLEAFHKYALMPMIPNMIKDRNLQYVHDKMVREGITYITFNSGSKLCNVSSRKTSDNEKIKGSGDILYDMSSFDYSERVSEEGVMSRKLRDEFYTGDGTVFTPNYIPVAYLKDQLNIHDEMEDRTILSTQLKRLIENNLFDSGVPYDYLGEKDTEEKRIEWKKHYREYLKTGDDKWLCQHSQYFTLARKFEKTIDKLTNLAIESIRKEFGLNDSKASQEKILSFIRNELAKKNVPQYAVDGITDLRELQFSFVSDQIENILMSMINSRVIRQKVNGGQFIQVAGTLWEKPGSVSSILSSPAANELAFYTGKTGDEFDVKKDYSVKPAHCKIPFAGDYVHMLRLKHFDGQRIKTLDRLNECLQNIEWCEKNREFIRIVAVRIPVQGHNSMEFLQIQEFIAPGSNNIIVCPTETVIKSGGDYDVDKLSCVLPNISNINGEPVIVKPVENLNTETLKKECKKLSAAQRKASDNYSDAVNKNIKKLLNGNKITQEEKDYINKLIGDKRELAARINLYQANLESDDITDEEFLATEREIDVLRILKNNIWDKLDEFVKDIPEIKHLKSVYDDANIKYAEAKSKFLSSSRIAYENELLETMCEIISLKVNHSTLLTPNSNIIYASKGKPAEVLESNAEYDKNKRVFGESSTMSPTRCTEYSYNLHKHDDFNVGKTILGPSAIDNVFSSLLRRVGAYMNHTSAQKVNFSLFPEKSDTRGNFENKNYSLSDESDYNTILNSIEKDLHAIDLALIDSKKNMSMYSYMSKPELKKYKYQMQKEFERICSFCVQTTILPHNTTMVEGNECIDISGNFCKKTDDASQYTINEEISEYITGCVDVAKGAWIKYIQGNMEAIPVYMYMIQAGIPSDYACYFISNPLIKKYIEAKLQESSNASYLTEKNFALTNDNILRCKILGLGEQTGAIMATRALYDKIRSLESTFHEKINLEKLKSRAISKGEITDFDIRMLAEYFRLEDQSNVINSLKLSVRVDATKNNNVYNVLTKQKNIDNIYLDEKIDPEILDAIKKDTVISSFFQDSFIKGLVSEVLPFRIDNDILDEAADTLNPTNLKLLPSNDIEVETRRYQIEFINYLWQKEFKTADSFDETYPKSFYENCDDHAKKIFGSDIFESGADDVVNKFHQNLNSVRVKYKDLNIRESLFYYALVGNRTTPDKYDELNTDDVFYTFLALIMTGDTNTMFRSKVFNFASMFNFMTTQLGYANPFFNNTYFLSSFNVVHNKIRTRTAKESNDKIDESTNLNFVYGINDENIGVLREEYANFSDKTWIKTNLRTNTERKLDFYDYKSVFTDVDIEVFVSMMQLLPNYSILQSGIRSSFTNTLNMLFPVNTDFNRIYNEFTKETPESKKVILQNFSSAFLNKFSSSNPLRLKDFSYSSFHYIDLVEILDEKAPDLRHEKGVMILHSGGAEGADQVFGEIAGNYGIQVNHYSVSKETEKSKMFNKDIKLVKISKYEYDYGKQIVQAEYNKTNPDNIKSFDQRSKNEIELLSRSIIQAHNADEIFAVGTLYGNLPSGGTRYAVYHGIVQQKPIYFFDQIQKHWFTVEYSEDSYKWVKYNATPIITAENFAGIGTREINEDGVIAIAELFRNSFDHNHITLSSQSTFSRKEAAVNPDVLYIFQDNMDRTSALPESSIEQLEYDKKNGVYKIVSPLKEAKGKYTEKYSHLPHNLYYNNPHNDQRFRKSEVLRGLDNALPITTLKHFYGIFADNAVEYKGNTYHIIDRKIFDKNGAEVFIDSIDDVNKIKAKYAVKNKLAVIVNYKGKQYVVFKNGAAVSTETGMIVTDRNVGGDDSKAFKLGTLESPLQIFSDGSDIKGTGTIGYGAVFKVGEKLYGISGTGNSASVSQLRSLFPDATFSNPTMELLALTTTLEYFANRGNGENIVINQDYKGAISYEGLWDLSQGSEQRPDKAWKAKLPYIKHLVERSRKAADKIISDGGSVRIKWVKGHQTGKSFEAEMNHQADIAAKFQQERFTFDNAYKDSNFNQPVSISVAKEIYQLALPKLKSLPSEFSDYSNIRWSDEDNTDFLREIDSNFKDIKNAIMSNKFKKIVFPSDIIKDSVAGLSEKQKNILNNYISELQSFVAAYNIEAGQDGSLLESFNSYEDFLASPQSKDGRHIFIQSSIKTKNHFGSPFTVQKEKYMNGNGAIVETRTTYDSFKIVDSISDHTKEEDVYHAYLMWLKGEDFTKDIDPERRKWILGQIKSGAFDGMTLCYAEKDRDIALVLSDYQMDREDTISESRSYEDIKERTESLNNTFNDPDYVKNTVKDIQEGLSFDFYKHFFNDKEREVLQQVLKNNNGNLYIQSASRRSDISLFKEKALTLLENNPAFGNLNRVYVMEIWSKHDGEPIREVLKKCIETRVAPLVSFSITTLGNTQFERGVLKYDDLLNSIEGLIRDGLLIPELVTIRIDPIVPGVTNFAKVDDLIKKCKKLGITTFKVSIMQTYGQTEGMQGKDENTGLPKDRGIIQKFEEMGFTKNDYFDKYYGLFTKNGKSLVQHKIKNSFEEIIGYKLRELAEQNQVLITSCQHGLGLKKAPCLDPTVVERLIGVNEVLKTDTGKCVGGCMEQNDILHYTDPCLSGCTYCYGAHKPEVLVYYDKKGNLITDNPEEARQNFYTLEDIQKDKDFITLSDGVLVNKNDVSGVLNTLANISKEIGSISENINETGINVDSIDNTNVISYIKNNDNLSYLDGTTSQSLIDSLSALDTFTTSDNRTLLQLDKGLNFLVNEFDRLNKMLNLADKKVVDDESLDNLINACKIS